MRKHTLKTLGIVVLSATMLASTATGCGSKITNEVQATEAMETADTTEAVEETEVVTEATEEIVEEATEAAEKTEIVEEESAFKVTDMSATKYAKQSVNVRSGASTDYEVIGSLSLNQKVTVTGQADTGWYRIDYNGKEGYVSNKYLSDTKVAVSTPAPTTQTATTPETTSETDNSTWVDTSTSDWVDMSVDNTPVVDNTPSAPVTPPVVDNTPVVDNSNSLGTIGGAGTGTGAWGEGGDISVWE